ncbi:MAG TPA: hypothetical protein VGO62_14195 [Myxococcota bacterium]|jgi:hypothetical protein
MRWVAAALLALVASCAGPAASTARAASTASTSTAGSTASAPEDDAREHVDVGGARIFIVVDGEPGVASADALTQWVRHSAEVVTEYLGAFPVPDIEVTLSLGGGDDIGYGEHSVGRTIHVWLGRDTDQKTFADDWVMIHEMFHAAMPDLDDDHRWMKEGLSTYLEPVARARRGEMTADAFWYSFVERMHNGKPGAYDEGLDNTHTWGRTYWGGALFFLVADVQIRAETDNKKSMRDATRAWLAAGGNARMEWPAKRVCNVGDRGTGTAVLRTLYAKMAEAPGDVDLPALWRKLGVVVAANGDVSFDDTAPLAAVRRGITAP